VGFNVLYRTGHITGSRYAGPGSKPEGLAALAKALKPLRKDQWVVLYCGCCPWEHCPNVHPAFREARSLGYRNVSVLFIRKNLQEDWIDKGFPMREGDQ
jgi:thiosulfate/3-mercaptopyruvate sulfurtransferase